MFHVVTDVTRKSSPCYRVHAQIVALDATMTMVYSWSNTVNSNTDARNDDYTQTDVDKAEGWMGEMRGLVLHPTEPVFYVSIFMPMHVY